MQMPVYYLLDPWEQKFSGILNGDWIVSQERAFLFVSYGEVKITWSCRNERLLKSLPGKLHASPLALTS